MRLTIKIWLCDVHARELKSQDYIHVWYAWSGYTGHLCQEDTCHNIATVFLEFKIQANELDLLKQGG